MDTRTPIIVSEETQSRFDVDWNGRSKRSIKLGRAYYLRDGSESLVASETIKEISGNEFTTVEVPDRRPLPDCLKMAKAGQRWDIEHEGSNIWTPIINAVQIK